MDKIGTYSLKLGVQDLFVFSLASVLFVYSFVSTFDLFYEGIVIISIYFSIFSERFIQIMLVINGYIYTLITQIKKDILTPVSRLFSLDFIVLILLIYILSLIFYWNVFYQPQKSNLNCNFISNLNVIIPLGSLFIGLINAISFNSNFTSNNKEINNLLFLGCWYTQYIIIVAFCYSISSANFGTLYLLRFIIERIRKHKTSKYKIDSKKKGEIVSKKYQKIKKTQKTKKPKYKGV